MNNENEHRMMIGHQLNKLAVSLNTPDHPLSRSSATAAVDAIIEHADALAAQLAEAEARVDQARESGYQAAMEDIIHSANHLRRLGQGQDAPLGPVSKGSPLPTSIPTQRFPSGSDGA